MSCKWTTEDISAFLDGEGSTAETAEFLRHLAACERCRKIRDGIARTSWAVSLLEAPELPGSLAELIVERSRNLAPLPNNIVSMRGGGARVQSPRDHPSALVGAESGPRRSTGGRRRGWQRFAAAAIVVAAPIFLISATRESVSRGFAAAVLGGAPETSGAAQPLAAEAGPSMGAESTVWSLPPQAARVVLAPPMATGNASSAPADPSLERFSPVLDERGRTVGWRWRASSSRAATDHAAGAVKLANY
ncbi:MAG: zf-HC2 domain-containing protein [Candidatus Schekmanbacteria bacterium]|nr:zf-HC2 domain-containing protein [Candidatus Schekmanbacteria bacterium]